MQTYPPVLFGGGQTNANQLVIARLGASPHCPATLSTPMVTQAYRSQRSPRPSEPRNILVNGMNNAVSRNQNTEVRLWR